MLSYLSMLESILSTGKLKRERGHNTIGVFALHFEFDLSTGEFPLMTTKRMDISSVAAELFCFIHGVTSKRVFQKSGTKIWNQWCNPIKVQYIQDEQQKQEAMLEEDDLGPIYGFQWRAFGQHYQYASDTMLGHRQSSNQQADQLYNILQDLRKNPNSRRMVCSAWCPTQAHMQALPPCHVLWNLVHYDGVLNLVWHQRSCDMVLGVPYNIASYALLLRLLCEHAGLRPGSISGTLADAHIYVRGGSKDEDAVCHRDGLQIQMARYPNSPPKLNIRKPADMAFDIFHWKPTDLELVDYNPHPAIKFKVAV
jgi:thymidylate synthase